MNTSSANIVVFATPPPFTLSQKETAENAKITQLMTLHFTMGKNTVTNAFNEIWNNPQGLTPQQVFDSLNTNAGSFLTLLNSIISALNAIIPGSINLTAPHSTTINDNGTVTVGS
jgi:hypothetical protein